MSVKIRMKMMGRKHRAFFRICATNSRTPRDGRVLEELGTYDPKIADTDARVVLNHERIDYWLSVGAQPSEKVRVFLKKYGAKGTHVDQQQAAREKLALPKVVPPTPEPVYVAPPKSEDQPAQPAEAAAVATEAPVEPSTEASAAPAEPSAAE